MNIQHLEFIVSASGLKLLKLYEDEANKDENNRYTYWVVYQFDPSNHQGEFGNSFHNIEGIELTDFLRSLTLDINQKEFVTRLDTYLSNRKKIKCKIHHAIKYKLYSS